MYVASLALGSLSQSYFHSVRSVPFQLQAKPQSHAPIIEALLKSVFSLLVCHRRRIPTVTKHVSLSIESKYCFLTVYKYSPNKMAIGLDKIQTHLPSHFLLAELCQEYNGRCFFV